MPHSPRWYGDKLWVLESGEGSLGFVDLDTGKVETVAELPGFTRGLDFAGPLAFVGLSQVRETATFSGIPITERLEERCCGVWVVDIAAGQTSASCASRTPCRRSSPCGAARACASPRSPSPAPTPQPTYVVPDEALKETA